MPGRLTGRFVVLLLFAHFIVPQEIGTAFLGVLHVIRHGESCQIVLDRDATRGGPYFVRRGSIKCTAANSASLITKIKTTKDSQSLRPQWPRIAAMKSNRDEKQRLLEALDALESEYKALAVSIHDHTPTKL